MYHFIVNPSSRGKKGIKLWQLIESYLINNNIDYSYYFTNPNVSASKIIKQIYKTNDKDVRLVILGGDGTINDIINSLSDDQLDKTLIGYIPTGSSNDFARSLKISKDPLVNLKKILNSKKHLSLDIAEITSNNNRFRYAVSSGVGYDAFICKEANESKAKTVLNFLGLGKFAYILKAVGALFKTPFNNGTVIIDGKEVKSFKKMFFLISMIHLYEGGGINFSPGANPTDGLLSVCIAHSLSRPMLFVMLLNLLVGKHTRFKGVELFKCSSIEVKLDKPWVMHTDGEIPGYYDSYKITCLPKKYKLMV
ncbi:MAG: YegS/Rv2252/BmrU family lipid kinase [Clostridiales bacterium]|nr:YegS/Rv2252/BmrU family lipid kinase [Clostridiales bacterium]